MLMNWLIAVVLYLLKKLLVLIISQVVVQILKYCHYERFSISESESQNTTICCRCNFIKQKHEIKSMTIFATDQYAIQAIVRNVIFSSLTTSPDEVCSSSHISVL